MEEEDDGFVKIIPESEKARPRGVKKDWSPAGIGVGVRYWKAKLKGKKFIDDYTYVEKEGRDLEAEKEEKAIKLAKLQEEMALLKNEQNRF